MIAARVAKLLVACAAFITCIFEENDARGQACCVGASGLTPGWLTNHESALVGAQLRLAETHGAYPTSGPFYTPPPGRDARIETSLFGSIRYLPRGQVSVFAPLVMTRRRAGSLTEGGVAPGDLTVVTRYDVIRTGESARFPGLAFLGGVQAPTGNPIDRSAGLLATNVTGIGAWELNAGASIEQTFGRVVLHATVLAGYRFPRDVFGLEQHLGWRALYLAAAGWIFDDDTAILATITHTSDGDATLDGEDARGTGFRATQVALLVNAPLSDTLRIRTSVFTDVPPLGLNRPAMGGTSLSLAKTWF